MKSNVNQIVCAIAHDNKEYITTSVADYILDSLHNVDNWDEFLNDDEVDDSDAKDEFVKWLKEYWS